MNTAALFLLLFFVTAPCFSAPENSPSLKKEITQLYKENALFVNDEAERQYFQAVTKKAVEDARGELNIPKDEDALALVEKNGGKKYKFKLSGGQPVMYSFDPQMIQLEKLSAEAQKTVLGAKAGIVLKWVEITLMPDGQGGLAVEVAWPDEKEVFAQLL